MSHTITIRPRADFEPRVEGIVNHTVVIEDGVEIVQESLIYIRALRDALTARIDAVEAAERGPEPVELEHPGEWVVGDRVAWEDSQFDLTERGWECGTIRLSDRSINNLYADGQLRITHLVPRSEVA